MKRALVLVLLVLSVGVAAAAQHTYAFYYNLQLGRDLVVNVMNTENVSASFTIEAYDAWGSLLWFESFQMMRLASYVHTMGESVPAGNWGVVVIQSDRRLVIGLEYLNGGSLVSTDNIYQEAPVLASGVSYWSGAYYSLAGGAETAIVLLNPFPVPTSCRLIVHMQGGEIAFEQVFEFSPYEGFFINLSDYIPLGMYTWGFADVLMVESAVILAVEYYNLGCSGLEVDNISSFYY